MPWTGVICIRIEEVADGQTGGETTADVMMPEPNEPQQIQPEALVTGDNAVHDVDRPESPLDDIQTIPSSSGWGAWAASTSHSASLARSPEETPLAPADAPESPDDLSSGMVERITNAVANTSTIVLDEVQMLQQEITRLHQELAESRATEARAQAALASVNLQRQELAIQQEQTAVALNTEHARAEAAWSAQQAAEASRTEFQQAWAALREENEKLNSERNTWKKRAEDLREFKHRCMAQFDSLTLDRDIWRTCTEMLIQNIGPMLDLIEPEGEVVPVNAAHGAPSANAIERLIQ